MTTTYPIKPDFAAKSYLSEEDYFEMYQRSIDDNEAFWAEQGN